MIDRDFVEKRLAYIEDLVEDLRNEARPERIATERRERFYIEHALHLAAQAALDIGWHVHAHERRGEPETNQQVFQMLGRIGWLPPELSTRLSSMAGFRNVVVHAYLDVDLEAVQRAVEYGLGDLDQFVAVIRKKVGLD
jgi:uncharacterized protein YutE (UPF0331/DUF86 family)